MVNKLIHGESIEVVVDAKKLKTTRRRDVAAEEIHRYWKVRGYQSRAAMGGMLAVGSIFLAVYFHILFVLLVLFFGKYALDNQFRFGYERKEDEELGGKFMVRIDK
jgi:hypothetical protein